MHTASMSLKNATFLAVIGTLLLTIVLAVDFVNTLVGTMRNLIPAVALFRALIYLFVAVTVTLFFFVFGRRQAR
jgi:hypothetical protein